ncbi:MAG: hypothetical protein ACI4QN_06045 [Candidatus Coproplasma sp.]
MSFFSNFQSDKCPGTINGNPLNGLCEKVCIQAKKIFDACIKQVQIENYTLDSGTFEPESCSAPLNFISARSTGEKATITNVNVERLADKQGCARVQATISIPVEVVYTDANGIEGIMTTCVSLNEDVLLFVPAPSIMPFTIEAQASAVAAEGSYDQGTNSFKVNVCITAILKVAIDVELLVPSYGYCAIPPAQDYSKEVCAGFFELPLYPKGKNCGCK